MAPTFSVLLVRNDGRFMVYIVQALNANIAMDACFRSALFEAPDASFRVQQATEISLDTPMKIMDTGTDPL
jgi:hypothetical protein